MHGIPPQYNMHDMPPLKHHAQHPTPLAMACAPRPSISMHGIPPQYDMHDVPSLKYHARRPTPSMACTPTSETESTYYCAPHASCTASHLNMACMMSRPSCIMHGILPPRWHARQPPNHCRAPQTPCTASHSLNSMHASLRIDIHGIALRPSTLHA